MDLQDVHYHVVMRETREQGQNMDSRFFTFGPDHDIEGFVEVIAPEGTDHRAVFMGWLGSNAFAFEYTEPEFADYRSHFEVSRYATIAISVTSEERS